MEVPVTHPAKRGRGRKPASESRATEYLARITDWKLTSENVRQPSTLTALAEELGITKQLASYYVSKVPQSIGEFVENIERQALTQKYPGIVATISRMAQEGHPEMSKLFMRQIVEPRRIEQPKRASAMNSDPLLQITLKALFQADPETAAVSTVLTVGNGQSRAETSNKVQLPANEESVS